MPCTAAASSTDQVGQHAVGGINITSSTGLPQHQVMFSAKDSHSVKGGQLMATDTELQRRTEATDSERASTNFVIETWLWLLRRVPHTCTLIAPMPLTACKLTC
jgi:hypothetical protein